MIKKYILTLYLCIIFKILDLKAMSFINDGNFVPYFYNIKYYNFGYGLKEKSLT